MPIALPIGILKKNQKPLKKEAFFTHFIAMGIGVFLNGTLRLFQIGHIYGIFYVGNVVIKKIGMCSASCLIFIFIFIHFLNNILQTH